MSARVVILVPRRAGIEDRDRLWQFVRDWWQEGHPDWPIIEGHHEVGPFNRALAINDAARAAGDWDVAVIIDADVLLDPEAVRAGVEFAADNARMVVGYNDRVHLTPRGTESILNGYRGNWEARGMVKQRHPESVSSCVIVNRELWQRTGGFDEAFDGWGWEDVAFGVACDTFGDGGIVRMSGTLFHLWHQPSAENNPREATFKANKARGEMYKAARYDRAALRALISGTEEVEDDMPLDLAATRIPRILHRTVPTFSDESDAYWRRWRDLHPGWELMTHRDPLDPLEWPETGDLWPRCQNGAQRAGLIRLEALARWGGVYVDSDVEPYRSLEPLLHAPGFAAWEDARCIPDAVLGFERGHPALRLMLTEARLKIMQGGNAWHSGPGVTTSVLQGRHDVLLLPPGSFYPYHYTEQNRRNAPHMNEQPWCFGAHHWKGSWLTPEQKRKQDLRQRVRTAGAR